MHPSALEHKNWGFGGGKCSLVRKGRKTRGGGCMEILGIAVDVMGFLGSGLGVVWSLGV